ncbi:MAG TPA: N-acetylmuramoyl-L-alanine amidase [Vicinamibacterales bacterium]
MTYRIVAALAGIWLIAAPARADDAARAMYHRAMTQEQAVRTSADATRADIKRVVVAYESVVRKHPTSGYCDDALWQGANLARLAYERFSDPADLVTAKRLFAALTTQYPASKFVSKARASLSDIDADAAAPAVVPAAAHPDAAEPDAGPPARDPAPDPPVASVALSGPRVLKEIHRTALPNGIRLEIDLDAEVQYHQEEIEHPRRLFFDLKNVRAAPPLQDATLKFSDGIVKEVRLGRHPGDTTRLVVDLDGVAGYTVYPLYRPYRLVVDFRRATGADPPAPAPTAAPPVPTVRPAAAPPSPPALAINAGAPQTSLPDVRPTVPRDERLAQAPAAGADAAIRMRPPATNFNGKFSLSRQLGLSVSRIVIDAGHGGHDPGAQANGINEADLTLDVAQRVKALLAKQPGVEVIMTRDSDVFIPLQERTAIANRDNADLFLSIHANASRSAQARGIETYFLNFAMNPEAEAVAARENASSGQPMHSLPDIVKAIALNNKINESRDFAAMVQHSMIKRLRSHNHQLRDLGVKQAPFVVLIGATMPSVLAEISFLTNKQEGSLLKTNAYRQQVAQALCDAVLKYQQALARTNAIAGKKATY